MPMRTINSCRNDFPLAYETELEALLIDLKSMAAPVPPNDGSSQPELM